MSATEARIDSLDVLRGVAVMGILVANLPSFGLPEAAYFSPAAWGGTAPADIAVWFATFVLVEGKMRGLFSLLFGASMLLMIERAEAKGERAATVHYRRMAWLFVIGCAHLYFVWAGDILSHYALIGSIAYLFARQGVRFLLVSAAALVLLSLMVELGLYLGLVAAEATPTPANARFLAGMAESFGKPSAQRLGEELAAVRGSYAQLLGWRFRTALDPFSAVLAYGAETLAAMLLGMAGFKSGFLTGNWERRRYRRWAIVLLGLALPLYAAAGLHTALNGFRMRDILLGSLVLGAIARVPAMLGLAALVLLARRPGGWLTRRIAAAGQVAFTNYLGTSLVMTTVFNGYGLGLFGRLSRAELYLFIPLVWIAMLAWSQPWLTRYSNGPFEWMWRSLARGRAEPMQRSDEPILRPMRK